jgi:hypothetical protein
MFKKRSPLSFDFSAWPLLLVLLSVIVGLRDADAAVIRSRVSSKVLLVISDDDGFRVGDTAVAYYPDGSRKAILVIRVIKNKQAIAEIRDGEPEEGDAVRLPPTKLGPGAKLDPKSAPAFWAKYGLLNVMAGASVISQSVKLTDATSVPLTGLSPTVRVSISNTWPGHEGFIWDLGAAIDFFDVKGSTTNPVCGRSTNCEMKLVGLTPSAKAGYQIAPTWLDLQLRGSVDLFIPATVSSNVVDYAPLIPLPFIGLGLFAQKRISDSSTIPIALDYSVYVGDQNVKIARLLFTVGYAWK